MASYHRVLEAFDRYTNDNDLQCDLDIHPWHIRINGERWSGKIRLIGFIDVFFLISYTGTSRFEKGIVIYKDPDDLEDVMRDGRKRSPEKREEDRKIRQQKEIEAKREKKKSEEQARKLKRQSTGLSSIGESSPLTSPIEATQIDLITSDEPEEKQSTYFDQDSMVFKISTKGHEIGLKIKYSPSVVKNYNIELRKHGDPLQQRRVMRALKKHDTLDLLEDTINVGIVSGWEVGGHALGHVTGGGVIEDSKKKFNAGLNAQSRSAQMMLSGDD